MRSAVYSPYLDTLGGGERYLMGVVRTLFKLGYKVDIKWHDKDIISKLEKRFGIDLFGLKVVEDINRGFGYDFCFWLSDGSVPFLFAKKNFIHFQVPFRNVNGKSFSNRLKFINIDKVIVNSFFTKKVIDKEFGVESLVVYPPVDIEAFRNDGSKKEKIILSVGRFSQLKQAKRQDVLIDAFKKMYDKGLKAWKLILAGGAEIGADDYINNLKSKAFGYPIEIVESPSFKDLVNLYKKARIFWSASGYGIDEEKEPERVEHFGITVVEAMSAGCVSLVFNAGGHKEIVDDGISGYLWNNTSELISKTLKLIEDKSLLEKLSKKSVDKSLNYSNERFFDDLQKIF